ncbi:MAG: hypothetical protein E6R03_10220 [Hyphomicrobiaceae bacterium]|nr:MAG: hypothetical protein E6R03_10220 [Hyphomicrobiaceae bacterium]
MSDTTFVYDPNFSRGNPLAGPGWLAEHPDVNDRPYSVAVSTIPSSVYLPRLYPDAFQPVVEDQIDTSSCTGNASTAWKEFAYFRRTGRRPNFSRLLTYWGARSYRGWQNQDNGAFIRDCFRWMAEKGVALESFHQFKKENLFLAPSAQVLEQAARHKVTDARRVERTDVLKAIASGYPVVGGFTVYNDAVFGEAAQATGLIRLPRDGERMSGGHAVLFSWYDEALGLVGGPNSWGTRWGRGNRIRPGWFEMPIDYLLNPSLSDDFWTATDLTL